MRRAVIIASSVVGTLLLLAFALVAAVLIIGNTDSGRTLIVRLTAQWTSGHVRLTGLNGSFPSALNLERLELADGKEARTLAERRRVLEWRESSANLDEGLPWLMNAMARERIAEMRAESREEDVDIAFLRKHRLPLDPPEEKP